MKQLAQHKITLVSIWFTLLLVPQAGFSCNPNPLLKNINAVYAAVDISRYAPVQQVSYTPDADLKSVKNHDYGIEDVSLFAGVGVVTAKTGQSSKLSDPTVGYAGVTCISPCHCITAHHSNRICDDPRTATNEVCGSKKEYYVSTKVDSKGAFGHVDNVAHVTATGAADFGAQDWSLLTLANSSKGTSPIGKDVMSISFVDRSSDRDLLKYYSNSHFLSAVGFAHGDQVIGKSKLRGTVKEWDLTPELGLFHFPGEEANAQCFYAGESGSPVVVYGKKGGKTVATAVAINTASGAIDPETGRLADGEAIALYAILPKIVAQYKEQNKDFMKEWKQAVSTGVCPANGN